MHFFFVTNSKEKFNSVIFDTYCSWFINHEISILYKKPTRSFGLFN